MQTITFWWMFIRSCSCFSAAGALANGTPIPLKEVLPLLAEQNPNQTYSSSYKATVLSVYNVDQSYAELTLL